MILLRGFSISCGPPISDRDWWSLALGIAEGMVAANRFWMRSRDLGALDLHTCGIRYVPATPRHSDSGWQQVCKLAPDVLHTREGSCLDLSAWVVALEAERQTRVRQPRPRTRAVFKPTVDLLFDPITQRGHAIARLRDGVWDPATFGA